MIVGEGSVAGRLQVAEPVSSMKAVVSVDNLVARCASGEDEAWRELHRTFHPQVMRFLRRLGVPPREAEDACQEVFLQVFRYVGRFEQRAAFRTWLYKLCLSQANRGRRSKVGDFLRRLTAVPERGAAGGGASWSDSDVVRTMQAALGRMSEKNRAAFVLFELEGLSGEETAEILACPVATVWRRVHHARGEFEQVVAETAARRGQP